MSVDGGETFVKLAEVESFSTKYKATNLKTGAKHMFRVSAVNKAGKSKPLDSHIVLPAKEVGKLLFFSLKILLYFQSFNYFYIQSFSLTVPL